MRRDVLDPPLESVAFGSDRDLLFLLELKAITACATQKVDVGELLVTVRDY